MAGGKGRSERKLAALATLIRRFAPPSPAGGRRVGVARFCPRPPHRREWRARPRLWLPSPAETAARVPVHCRPVFPRPDPPRISTTTQASKFLTSTASEQLCVRKEGVKDYR